MAEIEDELRGDYAEEFLREPDLLACFPAQIEEMVAASAKWRLRIIPHAYLRMVQRGIKQTTVADIFKRFIEKCAADEQVVTTGPYTIFDCPAPRAMGMTLRVDVDVVSDAGGQAHIVTLFFGRGDIEGTIEIELV